jgi:hypothetical protein
MSDLRAAEEHYVALFDMEVLFREGPLEPGGPNAELWGTLPPGCTWDDAEAAAVEIGMVALQRGDLILPLFAMAPSGLQTYAIGLVMEDDEIEAIRARLPDDAYVESEQDGWLAFVDRFGVRWQLSNRQPFRSAGERADLWLDVTPRRRPPTG